MMRRVLMVVGIACLSTAGFGLLLGVCWVTLSLVHGDLPALLSWHLRTMAGVLPVLAGWVAFVAVGCAASKMAERKRAEAARRFTQTKTRP